MLKIKNIMQTDLVIVRKNTPVTEALELIVKHKITGLPVVEKNMELVGIVSEKDLLCIAYQLITGTPTEMQNKTVEAFMSKNITAFRPDDNLADTCQCFIENPFRRVPIVDGRKLVGLITRKDVIISAIGKDRLVARANAFSN
ncbi:MAG: CBS domain-containing protein [Planctomycetes bacterium]|nr:CBS domain-containing protein [Planctomycetota bacterium]